MGIKKDSTIILEPEVWNEEIVRLLVSKGYTVKTMQTHGYDLIIGPRAWRIPKGEISLEEVEIIAKQAQKLIKLEAAEQVEQLNIPMEYEDVVEDKEVSIQEEDGQVVTRIVSAYRPAKKPGKPKQRTKVTRGGYASTDQDCEPGC